MRMSETFAASDLPIPRYLELAKKLYTPLLYGENSALLFFQLNGMQYDVSNMWLREEDRRAVLGPLYDRFEFGFTTLVNPQTFGNRIWLEQLQQAIGSESHEIENLEAFTARLKLHVKEGKEPVFFVSIPSTLSDENLKLFFELATQILFVAPSRIHILLCVEMRWDYQTYSNLVRDFNTLFQHTSIVPTARNEEVEHLVRHFCLEWKYPLSDAVISHLVKESGGIFLYAKYGLRTLISENIRTLRDAISLLRSHSYFTKRLDYFLSRVPETQRLLITRIANHETVEDSRETELLLELGLIRRNTNHFEIRAPFITEKFANTQGSIDVRSIVELSYAFSHREKTLVVGFIDAASHELSRDELATMLGKGDGEVSDWAIDQAVSRVRKKLQSIPELRSWQLMSKKKKGFQLIQSL